MKNIPRRSSVMILGTISALLWFAPLARSAEWAPKGFGAVADGVRLDTTAIQKAIDAAAADGGGVVRFAPGRYLTGTIELRTGVTLSLDKEAVLLGSPRVSDYRRGHWPALIKAKDQQRIGIQGEGVIDGQGQLVAQDTIRLFDAGDFLSFFPGLKPGETVTIGNGLKDIIDPYALHAEGKLGARVASRSRADMATWRVDEFVRPQLIELWGCRDVTVSGTTLRHAANWVQTYRECEDVVIRGLKVDSTTYWNNDGLDVVNCRRVRIEDCDINAADDGICLKSEPSSTSLGCEDITVLRCRVRSSASALKLGTASHIAFRRIRVEDLEVYDTFRSAVALESVDGAKLEQVTIRRVRAKNTGNAFFLRVGQRNVSQPPGTVQDIELSDFEVEVPLEKPDKGYPHDGPPIRTAANVMPAVIAGLPDAPVENVVLRDITIRYHGGAKRSVAEVPWSNLSLVPQRRENYPEFSMFGELPSWALFVRHAKNLRLENVHLSLATPDFRPALIAQDVEGLQATGLQIGEHGGEPVLLLADVRQESLERMQLPAAKEAIRRVGVPAK